MKANKSCVILSIILLGSFGLAVQAEGQITGVSSDDAAALVGQLLSFTGGATTSNETVTPGVCSGTFTGGLAVGANFLIDSGIILSSGDVAGIAAPNSLDDTTLDLGLGGDPFLDALVPGYQTYDA